MLVIKLINKSTAKLLKIFYNKQKRLKFFLITIKKLIPAKKPLKKV